MAQYMVIYRVAPDIEGDVWTLVQAAASKSRSRDIVISARRAYVSFKWHVILRLTPKFCEIERSREVPYDLDVTRYHTLWLLGRQLPWREDD